MSNKGKYKQISSKIRRVQTFSASIPNATRTTHRNFISKYFKIIDKDSNPLPPDEYIVDLRRIADRNAFFRLSGQI